MKTVIVTGVAGFIGSHLAAALLERGYRVVGLDNFDDSYNKKYKEENVEVNKSDKNFTLIELDICNKDKVAELFDKEKPETVIHLAAKVDTRKAVDIPSIYIENNIAGTINILEASRKAGVSNIVFGSSSSVYGNSTEVPWRESASADEPISPYGATKRAGELFAHTYHHNFGLNITCLRYFNVYGERNRPTMVPYLWAEALLKGEEIEISGDGTRKRDYTYINDVVDATIKALEKPLGFEIINIGNHSPISLNELLAVFEKVIEVKAKVKKRPSHKASVEETYADVSKAEKLLDWKPTTSVEEGITKLVSWFRNNRL